LKILHLNTYDSGGAGVAAINLHRACLVEKIDSQIMFLRESKKRIPNSHGFIKIGENLDLIEEKKNANKLNLLKKKYQVNGLVDSECITFPRTSFKALINHPLVVTADIIHLHWIARFVDFESFFLKLKKPVVWTFHDSNPFQGIFHYIGDLEKNPWTKEIDLWAEDIKRQAFKHSKIHVVTPSNWMQKRFLLKGFACTSTTVIRNPIPLPSSNIKADSSTNQTITKFIFSAWNLSTVCKRFDLFVKLAETLSSQEIQFFCLGKKENLKIPASVKWLGFIDNRIELEKIYKSVDATIVCSMDDNMPNVIFESMAVGTPVIGTSSGGIPELINSENGICSEGNDFETLLCDVKKFIKNKKNFCRKKIRDSAFIKFSPKIQIRKYKKLYQNLLCLSK
jgi:glycosyltransferase involved in cell wall biosynthesis